MLIVPTKWNNYYLLNKHHFLLLELEIHVFEYYLPEKMFWDNT